MLPPRPLINSKGRPVPEPIDQREGCPSTMIRFSILSGGGSGENVSAGCVAERYVIAVS